MPKISFVVAYDGRPFEGWQSQPSGNTIQDYLESAFHSLLEHPVRIHGSGRTDAGVHAFGQVFHIECDSLPDIPPDKWPLALNTKLPPAIRILSARHETDDFHARFSAKGKQYKYTISQQRIQSPLDYGLVWNNSRPMDHDLLQQAAAMLKGTHDFSAFAALRGNEPDPVPEDYFVRTIYDVSVSLEEDKIHITYTGNGFLYKMVRLLTGALHRVATKQLPLEDFRVLLTNPTHDKSPYCAPPDGLYLMKVLYE